MRVRLLPLFAMGDKEGVVAHGRRFVIGRSSECDLCLRSPIVSRRHCELIVSNEEVLVRDLESSNGTFLNDEPVIESAPLSDGDVLGVAINMYRFAIKVSDENGTLLSRLRQIFVKRSSFAGGHRMAERATFVC